MDGMTRTALCSLSPRHTAVLVTLVLAGVAGACRPTGPAAAPPASADAWAVVDGREIKRDEVEKAYRRTAQTEQTPSEEEALGAKLTLLNKLIIQDVLLAKARELKIELPETELDTAYAKGRKNIPRRPSRRN